MTYSTEARIVVAVCRKRRLCQTGNIWLFWNLCRIPTKCIGLVHKPMRVN